MTIPEEASTYLGKMERKINHDLLNFFLQNLREQSLQQRTEGSCICDQIITSTCRYPYCEHPCEYSL
jgi:hypothetical protein